MKKIEAIFLYILAMLIVAPCLLIISEGDTILPNIIGLIYAFAIHKLSYTKIGKTLVRKIMKINNYISKKI